METGSRTNMFRDGSTDPSGNTSTLMFLLPNSSDETLGEVPARVSDWWREKVQVPPDWTQLRQDLGWMWQLHTYGLACVFLVLSCIAFFTILGLRAQLSTRPHLTSVNVFLCLLGTSRTLSMFVDPYGSRELMPGVMTAVLWDLTFPCLLSSFSLLQLAFLQTAQVKMAPSRFSSETCVSVIVTFHFSLTIASDILWTIKSSLRVVWIVTQVLFIIWGLCLCVTFICGCFRVLRTVDKFPHVFHVATADYENKGILHLGTLNRRSTARSNGGLLASTRSSLAPKIRITDDKEQTLSYASDASHQNNTESLPSESSVISTPSHRCPLATLDNMSDLEDSVTPATPSPQQLKKRSTRNAHFRSPSPNTSRQKAEFSSQCQPLMPNNKIEVDDKSCISAELMIVPEKNDAVSAAMSRHLQSNSNPLQKGNLLGYHSYSAKNHIDVSEFRFDLDNRHSGRRTQAENILRRLAVIAVLGVVICLLQLYGVLGPHGLSSGRPKAAVLPWFCYQTVYRILEFTMGCSMATISRYSLHTHCHHSCPIMGIPHHDFS